MMRTITQSFTKVLFETLHLEWDTHAEARDLLSSIIIEEETVYTMMEDIIFSMSQFLNFVRESKGIPSDSNKVVPYFINNNDSYVFYVGNSKTTKIVFVIGVNSNDEYSFKQSFIDEEENEDCYDLIQLKNCVIRYFEIFYEKIDGEKNT